MANLATRSSNRFQELFDFRRDFDHIFNRFLSSPFSRQDEHEQAWTGFAPAVESYIDKDTKEFHCQVMLPGVDPKDVNIQLQGDTLQISGERTETREDKEADYFHREISYGAFQRSVMLPDGVDKEKIAAEYRNGMLEITAPVASAALPRKVEIKSLPAQTRRATA
jgi:HSP20 family protein